MKKRQLYERVCERDERSCALANQCSCSGRTDDDNIDCYIPRGEVRGFQRKLARRICVLPDKTRELDDGCVNVYIYA